MPDLDFKKSENIVRLASQIGKLKQITRTGWKRFPISNPESVADHSFRTSIMVMLLAPSYKIDINKAIMMALIHDLGEVIIGDIVTDLGNKDSQDREQKLIEELAAGKQLLSEFEDILSVFEEFMEQKSPEARFVNQIDKLEMALQAHEYEKQANISLEEFFISVDRKVQDNDLKTLVKIIRSI